MMLAKLKEAMPYFKTNSSYTPWLFTMVVVIWSNVLQASDTDSHDLNTFHTLYQSFLDDHLSKSSKQGIQANFVDYRSVKKDPRLVTLQSFLADYPKEKLESKAQKIAFYLNTYNILAIAKVAENWPLMRLKSLGTFYKPVWTHPAGEVCGEETTLRELEHAVLRKLGDPRIHFALNCASMSCPDLRDEPYIAENLEAQLEEQTQTFLAQADKGYSLVGKGKVKLSPIFDWFEEDFESVGGVTAYVNRYLPEAGRPYEVVGYLEYNWDVNCHLTAGDHQKMLRKKRNTWFD